MGKIQGTTRVKLYKNNKLLKTDILSNIIGYLYNRHLIDLPDEYWEEDDNGWKSHFYKKYGKIYNDFNKLVKENYKLEIKED